MFSIFKKNGLNYFDPTFFKGWHLPFLKVGFYAKRQARTPTPTKNIKKIPHIANTAIIMIVETGTPHMVDSLSAILMDGESTTCIGRNPASGWVCVLFVNGIISPILVFRLTCDVFNSVVLASIVKFVIADMFSKLMLSRFMSSELAFPIEMFSGKLMLLSKSWKVVFLFIVVLNVYVCIAGVVCVVLFLP